MDSRTLRSLEYDKIKKMLSAETACSLGKARVAGLSPAVSREHVAEQLALTTEARRAMEDFGPLPFGGLTDVSTHAKRARVGAVLSGEELNQVGDALRCARRVARYSQRVRERCRLLGRIGAGLHDHAELETTIRDSLNDEGEVMDSASPELARLRRQVRRLRERIMGEIDKILNSPRTARVLRERLSTVRAGRYCIPIKIQFRGEFAGIIHDRSDSGATVFMEPEAVVGSGNDLRQAEFDEQHEVERILKELSASVGASAGAILADLETLGELDLISARAKLSALMNAAPPELDETGYLCLIKARHPLLVGDVVPIDVYLGREFTALLITGPNTGGKTVTLKTVGLLCLMAQSGLHIPADPGSRVPVFRQVFADIGDEQSIEQSLSTFSSHMTQIVDILRQMGSGALVLLDEIGAGTDPTEGSALARALLETLVRRGAASMATTHYNELKTFAYTHPGIENASVEFDPETLRPTFRLVIGTPGSSNALEIAERLGLERPMIDRARDYIGDAALSVEEIIRRMEEAQRALERERAAAEEARTELEELGNRYRSELGKLAERKDDALRAGYEQASNIIHKAEQQAAGIIAKLQSQRRQSGTTEAARRDLAELREAVAQEQSAALPEEPAPPPPDLRPGDLVSVPRLGHQGVVVEPPADGKVEVAVGSMRVELGVNEVEMTEQFETEESRDMAGRLRLAKAFETTGEIHLRGLTVEEAVTELEKYLDDAFLAGRTSVRIVHGKGTGALRHGIHRYLETHSQVKSFTMAERGAGGEGVTIVDL